MSRFDAIMDGIRSPDPHRPVTQWNGQHIDQFGNHVLCCDGMWQIETPRDEFRRALQIDEMRELAR